MRLRWGWLLLLGGALADAALAQVCIQNPLSTLTVTSNFGRRFHPTLNEWRSHNGVDFRAAPFTPVYASSSGTVGTAHYHHGGGNMVSINGSDGVTTTYFHNERFLVAEKEKVTAGQHIADSGNTGEWTTGPHLHFEVRPGGSGAAPVDPLPYLCGGSPAVLPGAGPESSAPPGTPVAPGRDTPPSANGNPKVVPPASTFPDASASVSVADFLAAETSRRFLNPQWRRDIIDPLDQWRAIPANQGKEPPPLPDIKIMLWREIAYMLALDSYLTQARQEQFSRRLGAQAVELATATDAYNERILGLLRKSATSVARQ